MTSFIYCVCVVITHTRLCIFEFSRFLYTKLFFRNQIHMQVKWVCLLPKKTSIALWNIKIRNFLAAVCIPSNKTNFIINWSINKKYLWTRVHNFTSNSLHFRIFSLKHFFLSFLHTNEGKFKKLHSSI